ncbi:MAG: epoxyqueuosine reductase QueH [Alphaproteobacteria bacterium]|nr:epoxyqueuosine reductase QueH [Alphaproteobacteria bacterium]
MAEQIRLCKDLGVKYAIGEYNHAQWRNCILGFEDEPERGKRCSECFKMRIKWGANWARENGYDALATVFGVSKYKDQIQVDLCAASTLEKIIYLPIKWDEDLRISENKKYDFYRQKYCGCEFSLKSDM